MLTKKLACDLSSSSGDIPERRPKAVRTHGPPDAMQKARCATHIATTG